MRVRCPHCHHPINIVKDSSLNEIRCPSCGSNFSLIDTHDATLTYRGKSYPADQGKQIVQVGHFQLIERVGIGHFGAVWKAKDTTLDRLVALKIPRRDQIDDVEAEAFFREARAAAQLTHPNIVSVHEVGRDDRTVFIASEFIEGSSLKEWLAGKPLSSREAAILCQKLCVALQHAHAQKVVHRDLKPGNIMMDREGEPHISDFGLAKRETGEITMTADGAIIGTPAYMSPEQARGQAHQADKRSDIYSMGVILFEMLTGELPFRGEKRMLIVQIIHDEAPSPRKLNGLIPRDLETICLKCLEKDPSKRYQSAFELASELKRFLTGQTILARPVSRLEKLWRFAKRNPLAASLATTAGLLLLTVAVVATIAYLRVADLQKKTNTALTSESTARKSLFTEQKKVIAERDAANEARKSEAAARISSERRLAVNYMDHALILCGQREFARGLLWLTRSLETLPPGSEDLDHVIRANLAAWEPYLHTPVYSYFRSPQDASVVCAAFSPDSQRILLGSAETRTDGDRKVAMPIRYQIEILNSRNFERIGEPLLFEGHLTQVGFSPDGKRILAAGFVGRSSWMAQKHVAQLWDAESMKPLGPVIEQAFAWGTFSFGPDGTTVLFVGTRDARKPEIQMVNATSDEQVGAPLKLPQDKTLLDFALSPTGQTIATFHFGSKAKEGASMFFIRGGHGSSSSERFLYLWNATTGEQIGQPLRDQSLPSNPFSPNGRFMVTVGTDRAVHLRNTATGRPVGIPLHSDDFITHAVVSSGGRKLLTGSFSGTTRLWDVYAGRPIGQSIEYAAVVRGLVQSPDGKSCLILVLGPTQVWMLRDTESAGELVNNDGWIHNSLMSPDGKTRVNLTNVANGTARLCRVEDNVEFGESLGRIYTHQIAFSPDGKLLITSSPMMAQRAESGVHFWDTSTGKSVGKLVPLPDSVGALCISPDGKTFFTCGTWRAQLWDLRIRQPIGKPFNHNRQIIHQATFSPDGKLIATAGDGESLVWDSITHERVGQPLTHRGRGTVAFSADSKMVITSSTNGIAQVWDAVTGKPIGPSMIRSVQAVGVGFSPDGKFAVVKESGTKLWRWDIQPPISGDVARIKMWAALRAGMELDEAGNIRPIEKWNVYQSSLDKLGWPKPLPNISSP